MQTISLPDSVTVSTISGIDADVPISKTFAPASARTLLTTSLPNSCTSVEPTTTLTPFSALWLSSLRCDRASSLIFIIVLTMLVPLIWSLPLMAPSLFGPAPKFISSCSGPMALSTAAICPACSVSTPRSSRAFITRSKNRFAPSTILSASAFILSQSRYSA